MFEINQQICNLIEESKVMEGRIIMRRPSFGKVIIKRGIFQGDS